MASPTHGADYCLKRAIKYFIAPARGVDVAPGANDLDRPRLGRRCSLSKVLQRMLQPTQRGGGATCEWSKIRATHTISSGEARLTSTVHWGCYFSRVGAQVPVCTMEHELGRHSAPVQGNLEHLNTTPPLVHRALQWGEIGGKASGEWNATLRLRPRSGDVQPIAVSGSLGGLCRGQAAGHEICLRL